MKSKQAPSSSYKSQFLAHNCNHKATCSYKDLNIISHDKPNTRLISSYIAIKIKLKLDTRGKLPYPSSYMRFRHTKPVKPQKFQSYTRDGGIVSSPILSHISLTTITTVLATHSGLNILHSRSKHSTNPNPNPNPKP